MIIGIAFGETFTINDGAIDGDPDITNIYNAIHDPVPDPKDGDPDIVMFDRMKDLFKSIELESYVMMDMNKKVVY